MATNHPPVGRTLGQHIAYGFALTFYAIGIGCGVGAFIYEPSSPLDPIRASLMASVVFFAGAGIVLHVIGSARLKGILSGRDHYVVADARGADHR